MKKNKLTILLPTFNRLNYLKLAVNSCFTQEELFYELIIVDNYSTDGTREYLSELSKAKPSVKIIFNSENLGLRKSLLVGLAAVETEWVTILSDDDILCQNFVSEFYRQRQLFPQATCIAFSAELIDEFGCNIKFNKNPNIFLAPKMIFESINNVCVSVAGISNFCFKLDCDVSCENDLIKDYPNTYFFDTFLFLISSVKGGVVGSSEITYKQRVWSGQTSSYSNKKIFQLFSAMLQFEKDFNLVLSRAAINHNSCKINPKKLTVFLRSFLFPIATLGYLSPKICVSYFSLAWRINRRYIPHTLLLFLFMPFLIEATLNLRKWLNQRRKYFFKFMGGN